MPSDKQNIAYAVAYFRRRYKDDLAGLLALSDTVFAAASDTVTLTSGQFEGGSGSGEVTWHKSIEGVAIERLIRELDPDYVAPPARSMGITVRMDGGLGGGICC